MSGHSTEAAINWQNTDSCSTNYLKKYIVQCAFGWTKRYLSCHKLPLALLDNFEESITCHILYIKQLDIRIYNDKTILIQQRCKTSTYARFKLKPKKQLGLKSIEERSRWTRYTWTPGCVSCINSNNLLTTVFRNFQWALRNRGYWPTTYLII